MKRVLIDISFATCELTVNECFPDGAPAEWDAETILEQVTADGPGEWMLLEDPAIHVRVIDTDGDDSFAGEYAP